MIQFFLGIITKEGKNYGIHFPCVNGVISASKSLSGVIKSGSEALQFHIDGIAEDGDPMPHNTILNHLPEDNTGEIYILIAVSIKE